MPSFEQEMKNFLKNSNFRYVDYTTSLHELDFQITLGDPPKIFFVDVKEKMQRINTDSWGIPNYIEEDAFIIDELAVRKCIEKPKNSSVLVRNNVTDKYHFFRALDFSMMEVIKKCNRKVKYDRSSTEKGKWIIDLRKGIECENLKHFIYVAIDYQQNINNLYKQNKCIELTGEDIVFGGRTRTSEYRDFDRARTV